MEAYRNNMKKKVLKKLKKVSRLAMAEEYNCKSMNSMRLSSDLSDSELLELVGITRPVRKP